MAGGDVGPSYFHVSRTCEDLSWGFYVGFLGRTEIVGFWGLGGPGGPQTPSKRWGTEHPTFGRVYPAAGATQTPKIGDFRLAQKPCIKNRNVKGPWCHDSRRGLTLESWTLRARVFNTGFLIHWVGLMGGL